MSSLTETIKGDYATTCRCEADRILQGLAARIATYDNAGTGPAPDPIARARAQRATAEREDAQRRAELWKRQADYAQKNGAILMTEEHARHVEWTMHKT